MKIEANNIWEKHCPSDFGREHSRFTTPHILAAMDEYAKIVAANAFSNGWDKCLTSPISWKESEQKKYLENL